MADFVQTMRDWKRMCEKLEYQYIDKACEHCPIYNYKSTPCDAMLVMAKDTDWGRTATLVEEWAAENPEPVYPTWWKYMCMIGVIPDELGDKTLGEMTVYSLMNTHIQSDIAQKLGIEPKEG